MSHVMDERKAATTTPPFSGNSSDYYLWSTQTKLLMVTKRLWSYCKYADYGIKMKENYEVKLKKTMDRLLTKLLKRKNSRLQTSSPDINQLLKAKQDAFDALENQKQATIAANKKADANPNDLTLQQDVTIAQQNEKICHDNYLAAEKSHKEAVDALASLEIDSEEEMSDTASISLAEFSDANDRKAHSDIKLKPILSKFEIKEHLTTSQIITIKNPDHVKKVVKIVNRRRYPSYYGRGSYHKRKEAEALSLLRAQLTQDFCTLLLQHDSANKLWVYLADQYGKLNDTDAYFEMGKFDGFKYDDSVMDINEFISKLDRHFARLVQMGHKMEDKTRVVKIKRMVDPEYITDFKHRESSAPNKKLSYIQAIDSLRDTFGTRSAEGKTCMQRESQQKYSASTSNTTSGNAALSATNPASSPSSGKGKKRPPKAKAKGKKMQCSYCLSNSHEKSTCRFYKKKNYIVNKKGFKILKLVSIMKP